MPLNIRSKQADELAGALAKLTGESKTKAVTRALSERLARVQRARSMHRFADELDRIALHCEVLPLQDPRAADEILGYGEDGTVGE